MVAIVPTYQHLVPIQVNGQLVGLVVGLRSALKVTYVAVIYRLLKRGRESVFNLNWAISGGKIDVDHEIFELFISSLHIVCIESLEGVIKKNVCEDGGIVASKHGGGLIFVIGLRSLKEANYVSTGSVWRQRACQGK